MAIEIAPTETVPLKLSPEGVILVGGTRVTLDTVVLAFNEGETAEEISQQYPAISLADIYATIAWYLNHFDLTREYLKTRDQVRTTTLTLAEPFREPVGFRARLLARQPK